MAVLLAIDMTVTLRLSSEWHLHQEYVHKNLHCAFKVSANLEAAVDFPALLSLTKLSGTPGSQFQVVWLRVV